MTLIPVNKIIHNPEQPRKTYSQSNLEELAQTIKDVGLQQFIKVEDCGDSNYMLVDGQRRLQAHELAGLEYIEANVHPRSNHGGRELLLFALIANIQREDMSPVDEARAYERLKIVYKMKVTDIARQCGKAYTTINLALKLLELDAPILSLIEQKKLTSDSRLAHQILRIPDAKVRVRLAEQLAAANSTLDGKIASAKRVADALAAPKLKAASAPALQIAQDKTGYQLDTDNPPARWDALVQLNVLPPWSLMLQNATSTCDHCSLRDVANESTCGQCPLISFLRLSIRGAQ